MNLLCFYINFECKDAWFWPRDLIQQQRRGSTWPSSALVARLFVRSSSLRSVNGCHNVTEDALLTFSSRLLLAYSWWCERYISTRKDFTEISRRWTTDIRGSLTPVWWETSLLLVLAKRDRCTFQAQKQVPQTFLNTLIVLSQCDLKKTWLINNLLNRNLVCFHSKYSVTMLVGQFVLQISCR